MKNYVLLVDDLQEKLFSADFPTSFSKLVRMFWELEEHLKCTDEKLSVVVSRKINEEVYNHLRDIDRRLKKLEK